jgi:hypothetical protein
LLPHVIFLILSYSFVIAVFAIYRSLCDSSQPFLIYKYAGGAKDFSTDLKPTTIKRLINKELEQIEKVGISSKSFIE